MNRSASSRNASSSRLVRTSVATAPRIEAVRQITVKTERRSQVLDITALVREALDGKSGSAALVYVPHTTAGVTINEHADPMVARDFEMALDRAVPREWDWQHYEEGEDNAPSHLRASLMGPQVLVPLREDGAL